jgi:hypothetical protein
MMPYGTWQQRLTGFAVYQLLMLSPPLFAQAAVACMRRLRRLRLTRCRFQTPQMPGLPNILAKVPSLTVGSANYVSAQGVLLCADCCSHHGDRPDAGAACAPAVAAVLLHDNLQVRLHACNASDNVFWQTKECTL